MADGPVVIRSTVAPQNNYAKHREVLRWDFWYSCAYCTMTEVEAKGIGFQIDHYVPPKDEPQLEHAYSNLMWSCATCNRYKSGLYLAPKLQALGYRFFRPDEDNPHEHFGVIERVRLKELTKVGECTLKILRLNRASLRKIRELRYRIHRSTRSTIDGLRALQNKNIDQLKRELRPQFLQLKRLYQEESKKLQADVKEQLRLLNRSALLDVEPDKKKELHTRRQYLKELQVLDSALPDEPPPHKSKRKHRKGKRKKTKRR